LQIVLRTPIRREPFCYHPENSGSKVFGFHPRQNQETRVVYDQIQLVLPLTIAPPYELVPRRRFSGRGTETQQGQRIVTVADNVSQLCAGKLLVSQIVIPMYVFVPQQGLSLSA